MILPSGSIVYLEETLSTQDEIRNGYAGIVWTTNQTQGRGRADRTWICPPGEGLAVSFRFDQYRDHPAPYLVGMTLAILVAREFGLNVQWPNDVVHQGKKVAGILTEVIDGVPVVGLGFNVSGDSFPAELRHRAKSFQSATGTLLTPKEVLRRLISTIKSSVLEPVDWEAIRSDWHEFDRTPGKPFSLPNGEKVVAQKVTDQGHLLWMSGANSGITSLGEVIYEESK